MRELKFRDYDMDNKELRYFVMDSYDREEHDAWGNIMQYTGLKDKNGVDIYEGDILHFKTYQGGGFIQSGIDCYAQVVYGDHNFTDTVLNRSIGFYLLTGKNNSTTSIYYWIYSHKATVIGNIHQTPGLL